MVSSHPSHGQAAATDDTSAKSESTALERLRSRMVRLAAIPAAALAVSSAMVAFEAVVNSDQAQAAQLEREDAWGGHEYVIWLNKAETWAISKTPKAVTRYVPRPYGSALKIYLSMLKRSANDYIRDGRCMFIQIRTYWGWAHPVPVWNSYDGHYCTWS